MKLKVTWRSINSGKVKDGQFDMSWKCGGPTGTWGVRVIYENIEPFWVYDLRPLGTEKNSPGKHEFMKMVRLAMLQSPETILTRRKPCIFWGQKEAQNNDK